MEYDGYAEALFRWRLYLVGWVLAIAGAVYFGIDSSARLTAVFVAVLVGLAPTKVEDDFIDNVLRARHPEAYEAYGYGNGMARRFWFDGLPLIAAFGKRTDDLALETMKRSVRGALVFPLVLAVVAVSVWSALGVLG